LRSIASIERGTLDWGMISRLLLFCVAVLLGCPAAAQVDDRAREAEETLARIASRIANLPPAPAPTGRRTPVPPFSAVAIHEELLDFAETYKDLPVISEVAPWIARVQEAEGDVPAALSSLETLIANRTREGGDASRDSLRAATLAARWGAYDRALKFAGAVKGGAPEPDRADWEEKLARQQEELTRIQSDLESGGPMTKHRAALALQRFASVYPLHPAAEKAHLELLAALPEKDPQRWPVIERLLFFFPKTAKAPRRVAPLVAHLIKEGEYEKAWLYLLRIRGGVMAPPVGPPLPRERIVRDLRRLLEQVAARKLPKDQNTKSTRLLALQRLIRNFREPWEVGDALKAFVEDYPTCSERAGLELAAAEAIAGAAPEAARDIAEDLLARVPGTREAEGALRIVFDITRRAVGDEDTLLWIEEHLTRWSAPDLKQVAQLLRAELLIDLGRKDEAKEILEPIKNSKRPDLAGEASLLLAKAN